MIASGTVTAGQMIYRWADDLPRETSTTSGQMIYLGNSDHPTSGDADFREH